MLKSFLVPQHSFVDPAEDFIISQTVSPVLASNTFKSQIIYIHVDVDVNLATVAVSRTCLSSRSEVGGKVVALSHNPAVVFSPRLLHNHYYLAATVIPSKIQEHMYL